MNFLKDLSVLVLGLGDSGLAMARWCVRCGAQVSVWDSRDQPPHLATLQRELPEVQRVAALPTQPWAARDSEGAEGDEGDEGVAGVAGVAGGGSSPGWRLVLKSPGLAPHEPQISAFLALAPGVAVLGELDLFVQALEDLQQTQGYQPRLLAVTGTNGKTTVCAMTALLVERAGKRAALAGNIGPTLLDTLSTHIGHDIETWPEVWVLELSSFQLQGGGQGVRRFEASTATVLNISQDHLDWHGSQAAYEAAKARIFGQQAVLVLNRDDPAVMAMAQALEPAEPASAAGKGGARAARARAKATEAASREVVHFGLGAPKLPGDFGLVTEGGMAWLVRALPLEDSGKKRSRAPAAPDETAELHLQRLMPADALRVRGRHNAANALAALALATSIGCPLAPMLHGLREYCGEPHRLQFVADLAGVIAYDDSKGTNVGATVAAISGLAADHDAGRLLLILGGDGKGQDFGPLAEPLRRHGRAVATLGRDAAIVEQAIASCGLPVQRCEDMAQAVQWCLSQAHSGDALLLSPACSSLDMYRNYAHRAEMFVTAVQAHATEAGSV